MLLCILDIAITDTTAGVRWWTPRVRGRLEASGPKICPPCAKISHPSVNGVLEPTFTNPWCPFLSNSAFREVMLVACKSAPMEVFIPEKLANATNQGILPLNCQWLNTYQGLIPAAPAASLLMPVLHPTATLLLFESFILFHKRKFNVPSILPPSSHVSQQSLTHPLHQLYVISCGFLILLSHLFLRPQSPVGKSSSVILWHHA